MNSVKFTKNYSLIYGTQNGLAYETDIRNTCKPLYCWNYSHSPVLDVLSVQTPFTGMLIARQDGTVNFLNDNDKQIVYLTGSDCDPIYQLVFDEKFHYTACRDGKVRKYFLSNAF